MGIFSFFTTKNNDPASTELIDKILAFEKNIVIREDLAANILTNLEKEQKINKSSKLHQSIQKYLAFEDFIIRNKPMVVTKLYTKSSLREEIRSKFSISELPLSAKLLFLPEKEQLLNLYYIYTGGLIKYLINQVGPVQARSIFAGFVSQTPFNDIDISSVDPKESMKNKLDEMSVEELTNLFQKINKQIFNHIAASFGDSTARDLTLKNYAEFKEAYDYELITAYLKVIPAGILDKERVAFMTRNDLENEAMAVAEEKFRREQLQIEKQVVEKKVEEQTALIRKEKEALKQAVQHAQENEAKLLASVRALTIGFILTDVENNIITINYVSRKILRIMEEIQNVSELQKNIGQDLDITEAIDTAKESKQSREFKEVEINGNILHITVTPVFLSNTDKEYIGSVILIDDITEKKRLERTKDEFFAIASHELRTPLTAIRGSVSILKSYYSDKISDGDIPQLIGYIDQSANRLINIVNEFLSVSRLEQGRIIFHKEKFSIIDLVDSALKELHYLAESKNLYLKLETPSTPLNYALADKEKVKQILVNLIGNAIKFTEKGDVIIYAKERDGLLIISVTDSGSGISEENQKLLFRKFQQADDDLYSHDTNKGTGLGLYISKKLAENMGGGVSLDWSELGKGSSFSLTIPSTK